jgi:two-component system sensor histidine kinase TctE
MIRLLPQAGSIRRRLIWQMLAVAAVLSALLYLSVRTVADAAVETTQDRILGAAVIAIAEELRGGRDGVEIDIPYAAFSMLGAVGNDRIFYRILVNGETVTGYDDLPLSNAPAQGLTPQFYSRSFRGEEVRIAAVERAVLVDRRPVAVWVLVAHTQTARAATVASLANRAALLGLGFFVVAALLSLVTAGSVMRPVRLLAQAVARRGPQDLRAVEHPVPTELVPLVASLNDFIARLSAALARTETFIAEAAHHIRTPLATLRARSEIALQQSADEPTRAALRTVIRAADDSARSAGQLLDHAAVIYRSDQRADETIELGRLVADVSEAMRPAAELRDIALKLAPGSVPARIVADRLLVENAIRNLLDNAIKYSEPDGVVEIGLEAKGGQAVLSFRDRGRGLAGASEAGLSRRFRRGSNVEDVVGSGLGLTIVREVARAHGGAFTLREREGGGACAELSLPLA